MFETVEYLVDFQAQQMARLYFQLGGLDHERCRSLPVESAHGQSDALQTKSSEWRWQLTSFTLMSGVGNTNVTVVFRCGHQGCALAVARTSAPAFQKAARQMANYTALRR